jgi:hypothetical protein
MRTPRGSRSESLLLLVLFIISLSVYLANIKIPVGAAGLISYNIEQSRLLNISIERIYFNTAYPIEPNSTVPVKLFIDDRYVELGSIRYEPGREIRGLNISTAVDLKGSGPWDIYVYDDHLKIRLLVARIDRSTDLIIQTGLYTAILPAIVITRLSIAIESPQDLGVGVKVIYYNRTGETIDLGVCRGPGTCRYVIERRDMEDYEVYLYRSLSILYARIDDSYLVIYPYDNPQIFIPIPIALLLALMVRAPRRNKRRDARMHRKKR